MSYHSSTFLCRRASRHLCLHLDFLFRLTWNWNLNSDSNCSCGWWQRELVDCPYSSSSSWTCLHCAGCYAPVALCCHWICSRWMSIDSSYGRRFLSLFLTFDHSLWAKGSGFCPHPNSFCIDLLSLRTTLVVTHSISFRATLHIPSWTAAPIVTIACLMPWVADVVAFGVRAFAKFRCDSLLPHRSKSRFQVLRLSAGN